MNFCSLPSSYDAVYCAVVFFLVVLIRTVPEKVPIPKETRGEWSKDEGVTKNTIDFTLTADVTALFSTENGDITHYQIIVLGKPSNTDDREG